MLLNTTYSSRKVTEQLDAALGKPYSLWASLRMGGTGSGRMRVEEASTSFDRLKHSDDIRYASIELRPMGVIVYLHRGLEEFAWVVPFRQLVIFYARTITLHANGAFLRLVNDATLEQQRPFIKKLIVRKNEFMRQFELPY